MVTVQAVVESGRIRVEWGIILLISPSQKETILFFHVSYQGQRWCKQLSAICSTVLSTKNREFNKIPVRIIRTNQPICSKSHGKINNFRRKYYHQGYFTISDFYFKLEDPTCTTF
jgi:hypothetical protein